MTSQQSLANAVVIHIAALDLEEIIMLSDRKEVKALRVKLLGKGGKPLNRGNLEAVVAALDEERLEALALLLGIQTEAEESVDIHAEPVTTLELIDNMVQKEGELPPRLQEALSEAMALAEGAKETISQRQEPVAAPPPPRLLVIDDREYELTEDRHGLILGREGKPFKTFPGLSLRSSDEEVIASWRAYQAGLVREQEEKLAKARITHLRENAAAFAAQIVNKPDRAKRLTAVGLRDDASRLLADAGKGLLSRNARERLPLLKVAELCDKAETKVNELKSLASAKPEEKMKAEKAPNTPAVVPATQTGKTPVKESPVENKAQKPMQKVQDLLENVVALREQHAGLDEATRKIVGKDFLGKLRVVDEQIRGNQHGSAEKGIKAAFAVIANAKKLAAAQAAKQPTTPALKAETPAPAPIEAQKETIVSNPAVTQTTVIETTVVPAAEPAKETPVMTETAVIETTAPTTPAVKAEEKEPTVTQAEPTVVEPATAETVAETKTDAPSYGPKTEKETVAEEKAAKKAAKAAAKAAKPKSSIMGSMRAVAHNFDERMRLNFGPTPNTEALKFLAESLQAAVGGEQKALVSPKGTGVTRDALIGSMSLLVEAAATAKADAFTVPEGGKLVHIPTRISNLEELLKKAKGGEKSAIEAQLKKDRTKLEELVSSWGVHCATVTEQAMRRALELQSAEAKVCVATHIQALANYALARNLPTGEIHIPKDLKLVVETAEAPKGEKADSQAKMTEAVKGLVEGCTSDKAYEALMGEITVLLAQIKRLKQVLPAEEAKIEKMEERVMVLTMAGETIDAQRMSTSAATLNGWMMSKVDAPVWTRDHNLLVELVLDAKDGEHSLPGCGENKRETVGRLAASMLLTWAFSVKQPDGAALITYEWQRVLDGVRNAKQLSEQVKKPGFRGYGRQIVWAFYVGTRFVTIRVTGLISWAMSPAKGAWYALKALGLYGASFASKDGEQYKASARVALTQSKESFIDIVRMPWESVKATWNYIFGGKKASETKGESAPNTDVKKEKIMDKLIKDAGLSGITNNPFGGKGETWKEQSFTQKCVTGSTLPLRALKRVAVAQPVITAGVVAGGVAGGLVGSMVLGTVGVGTVGMVLGGAVVIGLAAWGVMKLFGGKKNEASAPVAAPVAAPAAPAAAPAAVVESSSAAA